MSLYNYPVVVKHAPALGYGGHSSHVMNVRWASDESLAVSVGGRDRCVASVSCEATSAEDHTFFPKDLV